MFGSDPLSLGVALAILAVIFAGVFLLLLRAAPRILSIQQPPSSLPKLEIPSSDDAVLLVEVGGRSPHQRHCRDWFSYADEGQTWSVWPGVPGQVTCS
jgi:hypothetical protein